jgi:hypothetical protein
MITIPDSAARLGQPISKSLPPAPLRLGTVWSKEQSNHPFNVILRDFAEPLKQYIGDLYELYEALRARRVHRNTFQVSKITLKKQLFPALLDAVMRADVPSFTLLERISLWHDVLTILPHRNESGDSKAVRNSYPRYDLANLFGLGYAVRPLENQALARSLTAFRLDLLPPELLLTSILLDVREDPGFEAMKDRVTEIIEQNEYLHTHGTGKFREVFEQIFENFGFGFNWIAMHLDVEDLEEELWK